MKLSVDDLILINAAARRDLREVGEPARLGAAELRTLTRILELAEVFQLGDPLALAAHLAAQLTWERPFGRASDRTAAARSGSRSRP